MRLYFKMRNIENVDIDGQKKFIREYIEDYCHFEKCGIEIESFIDHIIEDAPLNSKTYIIGSYQVSDAADFERIELKMQLYNVHEQFIIFAIV